MRQSVPCMGNGETSASDGGSVGGLILDDVT